MRRKAAASPRARTFDVVTAVWGDDYCRLFLEVCLANLLASGNLDALPPGSRYRVFTSAEDAEALDRHRVMRAVRERLPVEIIVMGALASGSRSRFGSESLCHRRAVTDAHASGTALIFICPDHFVSQGAFAALVRRHDAGARAVVCPGMRVDRDAFLDALGAADGARGVPPRELVAAAVAHLHASTRAQFADSALSARQPIGVFWHAPGDGILARCLRLHPLMVDPLHREAALDGTIDGHYVRRACPVREQVHVVADSDELALFEMSRADAALTAAGARRGLAWRAAAAMSRCDSHQQSYWQTPIRLHAHGVDGPWLAVEEQSARFARVVTLTVAARRIVTFPYLRRLRRHQAVLAHSMSRALRPVSAPLGRGSAVLIHRATRQAQRLRKRLTRAGRRSAALVTYAAARSMKKL